MSAPRVGLGGTVGEVESGEMPRAFKSSVSRSVGSLSPVDKD